MPITRIKWSDDELRRVAVSWIDLCKKYEEPPLTPKSMSRIAREAQSVLPKDRQRPPNAMQGVASNARLLDTVATVLQERKKSPKAQEALVREHEQVSKQIAEERLKQETVEAAPKAPPLPVSPPTVTNEKSLEALVSEFGRCISAILVVELTKALKETFNTEFPKLHARALSVSKIAPRILVCGPLPKQQPLLEDALAGIADLKFVSSEESSSLVKTRGQNCSAVVLWSNFISHAQQSAAKSLFGADRMVITTGGIDKLRSTLEDVALKSQISPEAH